MYTQRKKEREETKLKDSKNDKTELNEDNAEVTDVKKEDKRDDKRESKREDKKRGQKRNSKRN